MRKGDYLDKILRSTQTVFSTEDLALLWREPSAIAARVRLSYYVRTGKLYRIRRGLYAKDRGYDRLELATRVFTPAYVSFETVLAAEGLIFQYYDQITVATYLGRELVIDNQKYLFRRMGSSALLTPVGVDKRGQVAIASKERAFLDMLYFKADYYFDNLRSLDWTKIELILPIYGNKRLVATVNKLRPQ